MAFYLLLPLLMSKCREVNAFNRIAGERFTAEDVEGGCSGNRVTAEWLNHQFSIIDTGGIDDVDAPSWSKSHRGDYGRSRTSLFVVSESKGITDADEYVARMLTR